ncbi:MAG TPA: lysylphosphatidylglycerol synthase transmembrane domain-containing protein [Gaiellaceae bacterium]
MKRVLAFVRRPHVAAGLQLAAVLALLGFLVWAARDVWHDAAPRLRDASLVDLGIALAILAVYYLMFVEGWRRILRSYEIRVPYRIALQAEMLSMLAKYVPGGVWTPAARVVAMRRAGVTDTSRVIASVLLEAGLSAIAGVAVFLSSLPTVRGADAPLLPLAIFAVIVLVLLHPAVFRQVARLVLKPFGSTDVPPLPYRTMLALVVYYGVSWIVGGAALWFLLRSVHADTAATAIPYLGGVSAVGAIVAVLSIIAPSGLGVREASMYGLMLAVASEGAALGATVLNRVAITVVEAALLLAGVLAWRMRVSDEMDEMRTESETLRQAAG